MLRLGIDQVSAWNPNSGWMKTAAKMAVTKPQKQRCAHVISFIFLLELEPGMECWQDLKSALLCVF